MLFGAANPLPFIRLGVSKIDGGKRLELNNWSLDIFMYVGAGGCAEHSADMLLFDRDAQAIAESIIFS
jgi:hypothetical protein